MSPPAVWRARILPGSNGMAVSESSCNSCSQGSSTWWWVFTHMGVVVLKPVWEWWSCWSLMGLSCGSSGASPWTTMETTLLPLLTMYDWTCLPIGRLLFWSDRHPFRWLQTFKGGVLIPYALSSICLCFIIRFRLRGLPLGLLEELGRATGTDGWSVIGVGEVVVVVVV